MNEAIRHKTIDDNIENDETHCEFVDPYVDDNCNANANSNKLDGTKYEIKAIRVSYEDRYEWRKWVNRQPKTVLSDGTKVTLNVLFDLFREEKDGMAWPSKGYLAVESGGVDDRTIYNRLNQAESAYALIIGNRGGGVHHYDNGEVEGNTCHYYMAQPGKPLQGMEGDTLKNDAGYPEKSRAIPGKMTHDTLKPVSDNKPIDNPIHKPTDTPNPSASFGDVAGGGTVDPFSIEKEDSPPLVPSLDTDSTSFTEGTTALNPEAPNPSAMDDARAREPGNGVQGTQPVPRVPADLPVATDEQRAALCAAWSITWPDSSKTYRAIQRERAAMEVTVVLDAIEVLYIPRDEGAERALFDHIAAAVAKHRTEMMARRGEGTLTHEAIANVLAAAEVRPLGAGPQANEISDELLEEGKWL